MQLKENLNGFLLKLFKYKKGNLLKRNFNKKRDQKTCGHYLFSSSSNSNNNNK